jgi:Fe2+ or Zn2+ uptake regulation protein
MSPIGGSVMPGTTMAGKSPKGQLREMILEILRRSRRPLAAVELIAEVRRQRPAFQSQVFRELLSLRRSGAIRKIYVAKRYVLSGDTRQLSLFCAQCGALTGVPCDIVFDALDTVARARGYRPASYAVEVAGICASCGRTTG